MEWSGRAPAPPACDAGTGLNGATDISVALGLKRLQLLHDMLPGASRFGALVSSPNFPFTEIMIAREINWILDSDCAMHGWGSPSDIKL
jgi:hypothetical protein